MYSLTFVATFFASCDKNPILAVSNPSDTDRVDEVVEVDVSAIALPEEYLITDADGQEVTYQKLANGNIVLPVTVGAKQTAEYTIKAGVPAPVDTLLAWTYRPDCQDDLAWENEHSGYRLYGPAFRQRGYDVYGYDIWCKRRPAPVVKRFYDLDHGPERISYHKDHGEGFDGYTVGPTLGAGACALMQADSIIYPMAYRTYEIVDYGPLRLTVKFTIDTLEVNGKPVQETRTISLDRGAHFNKVTNSFDGLDVPTPIIAGVVVHADNPEGYTLIPEARAVTVVDLSDNINDNNGEIYVAAIVPEQGICEFLPIDPAVSNAVGQAVIKSQVKPGEDFVYYFGSGWSKNSVRTSEEWNEITAAEAEKIRRPLQVAVR